MKILIIGKLPPPVGGVTVFTKRHAAELSKKNSVDIFSDFRIVSLISLLFKIRRNQYDTIYIHSFNWLLLLLLTFCASRVVVIDHNHSSRNYQTSPKSWKVKCYFIGRFREVLVVSDHLINFYPYGIREKIKVVSTYYPPTAEEIAEVHVPAIIRDLIKNSCFIVCSAWRLSFEDGKDLYGFNQAIEVSKMLKDQGVSVKFVLCIGDADYAKEYLEELKRQINKNSLLNDFIFWENCSAAWALFRFNNCLYFRPTLTDGNSVSIHEAHFFGAKVLASNSVPRPYFVETYDYPSVESAVCKVRDIFGL